MNIGTMLLVPWVMEESFERDEHLCPFKTEEVCVVMVSKRTAHHPFSFSLNIESDQPNTPEEGLLTAVIERAVTDCTLPSVEQHVHRDARKWIHSKEFVEWSFLWIAQELNLSHSFVRQLQRYVDSNNPRAKS